LDGGHVSDTFVSFLDTHSAGIWPQAWVLTEVFLTERRPQVSGTSTAIRPHITDRQATSTSTSATLTVSVTSTGAAIGTLTNNGGGKYTGAFSWPVNPANVTVKSSLGGAASSGVKAK